MVGTVFCEGSHRLAPDAISARILSGQKSSYIYWLFEKCASNPSQFAVGWCSWLSRVLNTDKVAGSNPALIILSAQGLFFLFFRCIAGVVGRGGCCDSALEPALMRSCTMFLAESRRHDGLVTLNLSRAVEISSIGGFIPGGMLSNPISTARACGGRSIPLHRHVSLVCCLLSLSQVSKRAYQVEAGLLSNMYIESPALGETNIAMLHILYTVQNGFIE